MAMLNNKMVYIVMFHGLSWDFIVDIVHKQCLFLMRFSLDFIVKVHKPTGNSYNSWHSLRNENWPTSDELSFDKRNPWQTMNKYPIFAVQVQLFIGSSLLFGNGSLLQGAQLSLNVGYSFINDTIMEIESFPHSLLLSESIGKMLVHVDSFSCWYP
jgi:hypothetical protein